MHVNIVIGLSGESESDKKVLTRANEFLSPDSHCYLVHAIEHQSSYSAGMGAMVGVDIIGELKERSLNYLKNIKPMLEGASRKVEFLVDLAPSKQLLLEAIKQVNADLVIVGSHAKHGIALLLGSTADGVVHSSECDILAVRV